MKKLKGLLVPVFSLPCDQGIGSFSKEAFSFIDILKKRNLNAWQMLPINPIAFGNSPYQSFSSFAIEELYIDLEYLVKEKLIDEYKPYKGGKRINYPKVREYKEKYFLKAFENYKTKNSNDYLTKFAQMNPRIGEYAIFMAFKDRNKGGSFQSWIFRSMDVRFTERYYYHLFLEDIAFKQYKALKKYANKNGISIIGDVPFYVSADSSDVYFNRDYFLLNRDGTPKFVSGVGPDYFSDDGQRWGNPIYNYTNLRMDGYQFFIDRFGYASTLYDYVRIDHFRAFESYYVIDAKEETARYGEWKKGVGISLFSQLYKDYPKIKIIAEDLGDNMERAYDLRDELGLPGMNILEFNLIPLLKKEYKVQKQAISYIGTHDNDTLVGWFNKLKEDDKKFLLKTLKGTEKNIYKKINRYLFDNFNNSILSFTDVLYYPSSQRINYPSTISDKNWSVRIEDLTLLDKNLKDIFK